ncbi:MAG TPA: hypothetical protein VGG91_14365 [Myxococcaceae bacterium]
MKRLIIGMTAALALAVVGTARADDTKAATESKSTTTKSDDGTTMKTEKKTEQKGTGGSDTSSYSTEKKTKTDEKTAHPDTQAAPAK